MQKQLQSLQEENEKLKSQQKENLVGLQKHNADLEAQLDNIYNENGLLLAKLDVIESEKSGLEHNLFERQEENKMLTERLETDSTRLREIFEEIERLKIEKDSLQLNVGIRLYLH